MVVSFPLLIRFESLSTMMHKKPILTELTLSLLTNLQANVFQFFVSYCQQTDRLGNIRMATMMLHHSKQYHMLLYHMLLYGPTESVF
jgi:hypothetical protein